MESEYINFDGLRKFMNIEDINLLTTYLKEVFKDLSDRSDSNKKKGISKVTFLEYMKLPIFIAEKLFSSFDTDNDGFLNISEFVENLTNLYIGDFNTTIKCVFRLLDFDKDGEITKGDVKVLLSYLPLKVEKKHIEYKFQMESFDEIDEIIKLTFSSDENLKLNEFIKIIETKKSDVFLQILCFLYYSKPFLDENINMLKLFKRKNSIANSNTSPSPINSPARSPTKNLPSPNRKSIFSPVDQILKLNLVSDPDGEKEFEGDERLNKNKNKNTNTNINSPQKKKTQGKNLISDEISKGNLDMIRMDNQKISVQNNSEDINSNIKYSKNIFNSPSVLLKRKDKNALKNVCDFNLEDNLVQMNDFDIEENGNGNGNVYANLNLNGNGNGSGNLNGKKNDKKNQNPILFEDWIYKLS
jgi:Ca2+-binding EF-hand superfamily protein